MHSQRNHQQSEKTINRMGENICKWGDWQRINHQNIQTANAALCQNKNPVKKNWVNLYRHFSKELIQMAKSTQKDVQCHWLSEMQNKTTRRYDLTLVRMAILKRNPKKRYKWNCLQSRNRAEDVENKFVVT